MTDKRLPDDTVCACLSETGERKVEIVERCLRCGSLMYSDAYHDAVAQAETAEALQAEKDSHGVFVSIDIVTALQDERDAAVSALRSARDAAGDEHHRAERAERAAEHAREALRDLAEYGPLENTIRWRKMDSGHRAALIRARAALTEDTP